MNVCCRLLIGALIPLLISCAEAEPESTGQGFLLSSPQFIGGTNHVDLKVKSNDKHITLNGGCPVTSHYLEYSLNGGETWSSLPSYPDLSPTENLTCEGGIFVFHLKTNEDLGFISSGVSQTIEVRTHTVFGMSESSKANIHFDNHGPTLGFDPSSGSYDPGTLTYRVNVILDSPAPYLMDLDIYSEGPTHNLQDDEVIRIAPGRFMKTIRVQFESEPDSANSLQLNLNDTEGYTTDEDNNSYTISLVDGAVSTN